MPTDRHDPELEQLLAKADAVDAANAPPPPPGEPPAGAPEPPPDPARELEPVLMVLRTVVVKLRPSLEPVWSEGAMRDISRAIPPVLDKYGLTVGGIFAAFGPELALAAAVGPVAWGTWQTLAAERAVDVNAKPAPAPIGASSSSSDQVAG